MEIECLLLLVILTFLTWERNIIFLQLPANNRPSLLLTRKKGAAMVFRLTNAPSLLIEVHLTKWPVSMLTLKAPQGKREHTAQSHTATSPATR